MKKALLKIIPALCVFVGGSAFAGEASETENAPQKTSRQKVLEESVGQLLSPPDYVKGLTSFLRLPKEKGNAAEHYAKLEILYAQEKQKDSLLVKEGSRGVQEIIAASDKAMCALTPAFYPHMESGSAKQPDIIVFGAYRKALMKYAENMEAQGNIAETERAYLAGIIMGYHMVTDRPNLLTLSMGLVAMQKSADDYSSFLRRITQNRKARAVEEFSRSVKENRRLVSIKSQVFIGDVRNFNCLYSAIRIALEDKDPLWRQEAVVTLGLLRHGAPNTGSQILVKDKASQKIATDALTKVANADPRPWIPKLAMWAVEHITPERFTEMRRQAFKTAIENSSDKDDAKEE